MAWTRGARVANLDTLRTGAAALAKLRMIPRWVRENQRPERIVADLPGRNSLPGAGFHRI